jgi:hypothetical protein
MHLPLNQIEQDIRQCLTATANAETEQAAATAFKQLNSHISQYILQATNMNREHWQLRDVALKQATTIATHDLDQIGARVGESAPPETHLYLSQPETVTVLNPPDFFFIRLSYGLINIRHVVELDVKSKTLHTINSTRHLSADDVRTLLYHLKLYAAK